jgi:hypothetical protein
VGEKVKMIGHEAVSVKEEGAASGGIEKEFTNHFGGVRVGEVGLPSIAADGDEVALGTEITQGWEAGRSSVGRHVFTLLIDYHKCTKPWETELCVDRRSAWLCSGQALDWPSGYVREKDTEICSAREKSARLRRRPLHGLEK